MPGFRQILGCALALGLAVVASAAELAELETLNCYGGETLELEVNTERITVADRVTFTTRAYHVNGVAKVPAPTILMKAGEYCSVNVVNNLPATSNQASCPFHSNTFHCADTTVLHTHGLHVSPYEDNIDTHVNPQHSLLYEYDIPADHLMGTHWYHAHKHGSTYLQVQGGMVGGLLVLPSDSYLASMDADLKALYTSTTHSHLMMMNLWMFGGDDTDPGPFSLDSYTTISDKYNAAQSVDPNVVFESGTTTATATFYTVNAQYNPTITMVSGDTHLLRMIHGAGVRVLRLVQGSSSNAQCTFTLLSRDGVFHQGSFVTVTNLVFAQGTRADFAVNCVLTNGATTDQVVQIAAEPNTDNAWPLSTVNQHTQAEFFSITVTPVPGGHTSLAVPTTPPAHPTYLDDLSGVTPDGSAAINLGGGGVNGEAFGGYEAALADRYEAEFCVNKVYDLNLNVPNRRRLGSSAVPQEVVVAQERRLMGPPPATSAHPYHQHINHFQVNSFNGVSGWEPDIARLGEWRDVVPSHDLTVRFPTATYTGEIILHCHILEHEDLGMMGLYLIDECCSSVSDCTHRASDCRTTACTSGSCVYTDKSDGTACTTTTSVAGTCSAGVCAECVYGDNSCDDSNDCTWDVCAKSVCTHQNKADGTSCGGGSSTCSAGVCGCSSDGDCDDSNACTTDTCSGSTCSNVNVADGTSCGGSNTCQSGACVECATASDCDDSNACTTDTCDSGTCNNAAVSEGTSCGGSNVCSAAGACVECNSATDCDDSDPCTTDTCSAGSCNNAAVSEGTSCGGSNVCTAAGACVACVSNSDCDDSNDCTTDTCSGNTCSNSNVSEGTACGSGNVCTATGTCVACNNAGDCDDSNACTTDTCSGNTCSNDNVAQGTSCGGSNVCSDTGTCVACNDASDCDDSNACTTDTCVANACVNTNVALGTSCGGSNVCTAAGSCVECNTASDCDDSNDCTTDTCSAGTCGHSNIASGTACGSGDVCNGSGTCVDCMTASDCDDSLECTVDTCSSNTCANTNKAAGTSCAQGTCAGSVCDDGAAPSVSNVGLSQTTSTSMTATGSVDEASTIRCVLLSSTASVPAKSVVSVSASTSVMASAGSFSVTISNVAGTGSKTAYCMGIDAGGAQGDVISSASTSFDQTAPALSSMTATGATTGGSVTVTASIDEAATVFCATQSASAATDMTVTAVIDAGNSVAVGASGSFTTTFSSSLNNAAVDVLCVARDSWENTGASATVVADVTVGVIAPTCSDGELNGDESDTDCGHTNDGCSLCDAGRVCTTTSNCAVDTICASDSGSNLCTDVGSGAAGTYVLFEAVLHGTLTAEHFVDSLRSAYLTEVAALLGVDIANLFIKKVTTTNSINVVTDVLVPSGTASSTVEASVNSMLTTSAGTSPLRDALISNDATMSSKITSTAPVSVSSDTRAAVTFTEVKDPEPSDDDTDYKWAIYLGVGVGLVAFLACVWYFACHSRNKKVAKQEFKRNSERNLQTQAANRQSIDRRAQAGVNAQGGGTIAVGPQAGKFEMVSPMQAGNPSAYPPQQQPYGQQPYVQQPYGQQQQQQWTPAQMAAMQSQQQQQVVYSQQRGGVQQQPRY